MTRASGFPAAAAALALALAPAGCSTVTQVGTMAGQAAGVLSAQQADSLNRTAAAVEKTWQDITPEQEHYIGRSVAATVLAAYRPCDAPAANAYLNRLGQSLALYAERPETYAGYRFLLLESDEVNAFAAPGGLILVSRGMLRCCGSEDELAAVLAHEIGHVQHQHGLKAIKKGRLTSALTVLALEAGKNLAGEELAGVTRAFEGSISDITSTLMNNGYARALEVEADAAAVRILRAAGYDPHALVAMLRQMQGRLAGDARGFGRTHPAPEARIASVQALVGPAGAAAAPAAARGRRFGAALEAVR